MLTLESDYRQIEPQVRAALYAGLGQHIAVSTEEVDGGRVFVNVVAPRLDDSSCQDLSSQERQDAVWAALHPLGPDTRAVSLILAFGTDEICVSRG